ncbi:unnamed protein product [Orchesella dallaii]|uniref:F-box domain-containing protein n=1 Tax=Orchesella dallaii TaxID=48710 RepID=A0ABP1RT19_9HEXA
MDQTVEELPQHNPLLNEVILKGFFRFCSLPDLANCRLVCKTWESAAQPLWYERATVQIVPTIFTTEEEGQADILNIQFRPSIFQSYLLKGLNLNSDSEWMQSFWTSCRDFIVHLTIKNCTIDYLATGTLQDLLYRCTPNLKTLKLEKFHMLKDTEAEGEEAETKRFAPFGDVAYDVEQRNLKKLTIGISDQDLPLSLGDILKLYPCLENLRVHCVSTLRYTGLLVNGLLNDMLNMTMSYKLRNLKTLDIIGASNGSEVHPGTLDTRTVEYLREMKLPLECLTIELARDTTFENVQEIFSLYANSLKKLDIFRPAPSLPFPTFPCNAPLKFLTVLRMQDNMCKDMSFLKLLPSLEILHICEVELQSWAYRPTQFSSNIIKNTNEGKMRGFKSETVKEFRFDFPCEPDEIKKLIRWMPNVQRLMMRLRTETLELACKGWPSLTAVGAMHIVCEHAYNLHIKTGMLYSLKNLTNFHYMDPHYHHPNLMDNTGFFRYRKDARFWF